MLDDCLTQQPRILYDRHGAQSRHDLVDCSGGDCACGLAAFPAPIIDDIDGTQWDERAFKAMQPVHTSVLSVGLALAYGPYSQPTLLNQAAQNLLKAFAEPQTVAGSRASWPNTWQEASVLETIKDLASTGLLVDANNSHPRLEMEPRTLSTWLHMTDRCNLRCAYCYLPHERVDMSLEMGQRAVDATIRSALANGYSSVRLKYAGGEPLIRFPRIVALHKYALKNAMQNGLQLEGIVLSNGTLLTEEIATTMTTLDLNLMVSLDGFGRLHDEQRYFKNGHGSFSEVSSGIELAILLGLVPEISVTVTGRSASGLSRLVKWLLARELHFGLNFVRENDLSSSRQTLLGEEQAIIAGMRAAFAEIEANLPITSVLHSIVDRANLTVPHTHTCGVGQNYLVFNHRGQISKCQMHQQQAITDVDSEDPLRVIRMDRTSIQNIHVDEKAECQSCQWKYWCGGGCPIVTFRATGRYDVKSPNCNIYKTLYPEAMRLEGLRLLKHC